MPYDPKLLFEQISVCLNENPRKTLEDLAQTLRVSKRTIKKTVRSLTGGNFRHYREGASSRCSPAPRSKSCRSIWASNRPVPSRARCGERQARAPENCAPSSRKLRQRKGMRRFTKNEA